MVCTYFLLANIVVFGFGRKNKHVMPDVYEIEGRIQFLPFFCLSGKAGLVYIQKS